MRLRESTTGRLAMAGPMVLFVGIFVVCCGILTCVFFRGAQLSREAAQYNEAVMLCRSQAERLRAGEALPEHSCFDGSLAQCGAEDAEYLLSTAAEPRQGCVCWTLTVSTPKGEALYSLEIFMEEARR